MIGQTDDAQALTMNTFDDKSVSWRFHRESRDSGIEWLGAIPHNWEVFPLFRILREHFVRNTGNKVQDVLSLSYGRIVPRDVDSNFGLLPESFETYQIVEPGNIVLRLTDLQNDRRSLRVGHVKQRGIITSAYVILESASGFDDRFAFYLLDAYDLLKVFYGMGAGVRQTMKFADLKRMPCVVPPRAEQEAIARVLDHETARIDALIEKQELLIRRLEEKRKALITRTVTQGLNPHAKMKESGVPWFGHIPKHWLFTKLGYLVDMQGGHTPDKSNEEYWSGDVPWVSPKDMKRRTIADSEDHVSLAAIKETGLRLLAPPVVLIVVRGMILARTFPVAITGRPVTINQDMKALTPRPECSADFLTFLLEGLSDAMLGLVADSAHGTKVLRTDRWKHFEIFLPPRDEQAVICERIRMIDAEHESLIRQSQAVIARLTEYRIALIAAAVTGKIDVREVE